MRRNNLKASTMYFCVHPTFLNRENWRKIINFFADFRPNYAGYSLPALPKTRKYFDVASEGFSSGSYRNLRE